MYYIITILYAVSISPYLNSMQSTQSSLHTIYHPAGQISIPSAIANTYSFFTLQSNSQWKSQKVTLNTFYYKHIKQFFDLVENKQPSIFSWHYGNNNSITDQDVEPLLDLNNFLSTGIPKQQALIATAIGDRLKSSPKTLYNSPLLTLYEGIFDNVDGATQKNMALQADYQNEYTSLCCALYMAMYNPKISSLWHQVTKATAIGCAEKDRKCIFDLDEKVEFSDPFFLALQKWKQEDPARRLFGKLMDALGHDSTTPSISVGEYYWEVLHISKAVTSLHNFDICYWYLNKECKVQKDMIKLLYADNTFDRTHLPLIAEWCRYIQEKVHQKTIESRNVNHLEKIEIGDNQSIRRFYDVDSLTLHKPIFSTKTRIECDAKPTAHFDSLNTLPPSKEITFSLCHLPPHIDAACFEISNSHSIYKVLPAWWRVKTIAHWTFIVGGLYYIHRKLQILGYKGIQIANNEIMQHMETIKQHPTALSILKITNPALISKALNDTTIIPSLPTNDQITTTPESLILIQDSLKNIEACHSCIAHFKDFWTKSTIPSAGLLGYIWYKGPDSLANLLYAIFPSCISRKFSSYIYPSKATCTIHVQHKDT